MKILCCCRSYPTFNRGGMEMVCQNRAEELARQGHEVHVVTAGGPTGEIGGVTVHVPAGSTAKPGKYSQELADGMVALSKSLRPDILHLDSFDAGRLWWLDRPGNPKTIACTLHGCVVSSMTTAWNHYRCGMDSEPQVVWSGLLSMATSSQTFDRIVCISPYEQGMSKAWTGCFDTKLVYNPIHGRFFGPHKPLDPNGAFLCNDQRWPDLAKRAGEIAGLPVIALKGVAPQDMPRAYDEARGFLIPTFCGQGYDLMAAEAAARGRPVIAFAAGSFLMNDSPWLVKVPMGDVAAMARAMRGPLPVVPEGAVDVHRPENHVKSWLEAVQ